MYFNPVSCHLMSFSHKIKCDLEPSSKATCSASSEITGVLKNKISYESIQMWFFCFLHLNCLFKRRWGMGYTHSSCPLQSPKLIFHREFNVSYFIKNHRAFLILSLSCEIFASFTCSKIKICQFLLRVELMGNEKSGIPL